MTRSKSKMFSSNCYYCGNLAPLGKPHHLEHVKPKCLAGSNSPRNLVAACASCNFTKGRRPLEVARTALILKRLGWPKFTNDQLTWLKVSGFDTSPVENGKLFFEESGQ